MKYNENETRNLQKYIKCTKCNGNAMKMQQLLKLWKMQNIYKIKTKMQKK